MASSVEEKFKKTIIKVFRDDNWEDIWKGIEPLYNKVLEKREENLKNGKAEDGCGKYGDDSTTIELMLYIRKLMREKKLISAEPLKNYLHGKPLTKKELKKEFIDFIEQDGENRSWLTKEYEKRFHNSYESEPESHSKEYFYDEWDYSKYQNEISFDADIEWLFEFKDGLVHIYYNELDHYLTHLVGVIRKNTCDKSWRGVHIKEDF